MSKLSEIFFIVFVKNSFSQNMDIVYLMCRQQKLYIFASRLRKGWKYVSPKLYQIFPVSATQGFILEISINMEWDPSQVHLNQKTLHCVG